MRSIATLAVAALGLAACAPPALAGAGELGMTAPALDIQEWVKGKPVDLAAGKGKTIHVIEFWATWCPPCRASIPHLTELQKKFKDQGVVFVGVSDEKVDVVRKFVDKMAEKMDYVVAVDNERKTSKGYMGAFGVNGIPHAFIVDQQGRIVWNGHPMAELEQTLQEMIAGRYDLAKAKKRDAARQKLEQFQELAMEGGDETKLAELGKELEALDKELGGITPGRPFKAEEMLKMVKFQKAFGSYRQALASGESEAELAKLEKELKAVAPEGFDLERVKASMASTGTVQKYLAAAQTGNKARLAELGPKLAAMKLPAEQLNEIAWTILTDEDIKERDLKLATQLAKEAMDASDGKDAAIIDTYARALFDTGKVEDAIKYQKQAVELVDDDEMKKEFETTLKRYQAKK